MLGEGEEREAATMRLRRSGIDLHEVAETVARHLAVTASCVNRHVAAGELSEIARSIIDS